MKKNRILFIDDEPMILLAVPPVLQRHGFAVTTAPDNDEALAHLERDPQGFDLVIQDCSRPLGKCLADVGPPNEEVGSTGMLFLRRHIWRLNPRLSCLFLTGASEDVLGPGLRANPLVHYMSKPCNEEQLIAALWEILTES